MNEKCDHKYHLVRLLTQASDTIFLTSAFWKITLLTNAWDLMFDPEKLLLPQGAEVPQQATISPLAHLIYQPAKLLQYGILWLYEEPRGAGG